MGGRRRRGGRRDRLSVLRGGRLGLRMRAVRDDEVAARLNGIAAGRVKVLAFTASSVAAGVGGAVLCFVTQSVSPGAYTLAFSLLLVVAVVIGGLGSILGAALGSVVIVLLPWLIGTRSALEPPGRRRPAARRQPRRSSSSALLLIAVMAALARAASAARCRHGCAARRIRPTFPVPTDEPAPRKVLVPTERTEVTPMSHRRSPARRADRRRRGLVAARRARRLQHPGQPLTPRCHRRHRDDRHPPAAHRTRPRPATRRSRRRRRPTSTTSTTTAASTAAPSSTSSRTTATTRRPPRPWCANSCRRTRSSRSSTASARRRTPRCSTTSTRTRCPTCSSPRASTSWNQPEKYPYTFAFNADYVDRGRGAGAVRAGRVRRQEGLPARPGRRLRRRVHRRARERAGRRRAHRDAALLGVEPGRRRADRRDAGGRLRDQHARDRQRLHGAGASARPRSSAGSPQWFSSSSGADYPTLVGYLGEDVGPKLLQGFVSSNYLPLQPRQRLGRAVRGDQRRVQRRRAVQRQHGVRHVGRRTCSPRRWPRPARTRRGRACSTARQIGRAGRQRHRAAVASAKDSHAAYRGVGITTVDQGVQDYIDGEMLHRRSDGERSGRARPADRP